jgi:plastocyanin
VRIPRVLFVVPLLGLAVFLPERHALPAPPAGAVGMEHERFTTDSVVIPLGGRVTFVNSSRWLHLLGPGDDGRLAADPNVPKFGPRGIEVAETADTYTTGPWMKPGTYRVTCALHPEMTLRVTVAG